MWRVAVLAAAGVAAKAPLLAEGTANGAPAARRVALIIGNGAYGGQPLANPENDASAMRSALAELGFEVMPVKANLKRAEMAAALKTFAARLESADAGFFYYAGHGVQDDGRNYLIPVDVDLTGADLTKNSLALDDVIDAMAKVKISIIVLDACRDNPSGRRTRSAARGLAPVAAISTSLIAFATSPGQVAQDGIGHHGLYTEKLLDSLANRGDSSLEAVFKRAASAVAKQTGGKQVPTFWASITGSEDFTFRVAAPEGAAARPARKLTREEEARLADGMRHFDAAVSHFRVGRNSEGDVESGHAYRLLRPLEAGLDPDGQAALGMLLYWGEGGVPKEQAAGLALCRQAAAAGSARGETAVGVAYLEGQAVPADPREAATYLQRAANKGQVAAQFFLSDLLATGNGVPRNPTDSLFWLKKAADGDYSRAQVALGYRYSTGDMSLSEDGMRPVPPDVEKAMFWFQKAADLGDTGGYIALGDAFWGGQGVDRNAEKALTWYQKAAARGDAGGQLGVGTVYEWGPDKDLTKAASWYRKAADQGEDRATINLARLYHNGQGVQQDHHAEFGLLTGAAGRGNLQAMFLLGLAYALGDGVKKDATAS
jgi:TPR repeat protein